MNAAGRRKTQMTQLQESNAVRRSLLNRLASAMHDSGNFYAFSPLISHHQHQVCHIDFLQGGGTGRREKNSQVSCLCQSRPRLPGNTVTWLGGNRFSGLTQCPKSHLRIFEEKHGCRWIINAINQVFVCLVCYWWKTTISLNGWFWCGRQSQCRLLAN